MKTNDKQVQSHGPGKWLAGLVKLIRVIVRLLGKRKTSINQSSKN